MAIACPHCGVVAPIDSDVYCGNCREPLAEAAPRIQPVESVESLDAGNEVPTPQTDSEAPDSSVDEDSSPTGPAEILPPTLVSMRAGVGTPAGWPVRVMAALTSEALWLQETWALRRVPLCQIRTVESVGNDNRILLATGTESLAETIELTFSVPGQGERWASEIRTHQKPADPAAAPSPAGVTLIRGKLSVPHTVLGRVHFTDQSAHRAGWGIRLRAGMMGADTVINVVSMKVPGLGAGGRQFVGEAIRVSDDDEVKQLRMLWYGQECKSLFKRCIICIAIAAAMVFLAGVLGSGKKAGLAIATGQTRSEAIETSWQAVAIIYSWPLILLILLRMGHWPQILRATGLAVLAATSLRGLAVFAGHALAVATTGVTLVQGKVWYLLDPVEWAFIIVGGVLCARAWRLSNEARQILPPELQVSTPARRFWSKAILGATVVYALVLPGWLGWARFEGSCHLLQPGIDVEREHEAMRALNEGAVQAENGDMVSAERSFRRALKLWEELTARPPAPPIYRRNLAVTLANIGWIEHEHGHLEEAKDYYSRCVAVADGLEGDPAADDDFKQILANARASLATLRNPSLEALAEKDRTATRKFEEAQVQSSKGDASAERLYMECISVWEEILPQATNPAYRQTATVRLAEAYHVLGEFQRGLGKRTEAEASLRKAVEYGERAMPLSADRPLVKHNLDVARRLVVELREQAHSDAIAKLFVAQRFADAVELSRRGIAEAEEQVRTGKDREMAEKILAYRLDRLAWFLSHTPAVRDTKAAVGYARRATVLQPAEGEYWFTLGMVQYRNGDWRESLATLEQVRAREGEYDASRWLLIAMNRHRLGQREEAQACLRNAIEWINRRKQDGEKNALLLWQYEQARPALEALRREAEQLIEGKPRVD